MKKLASLLLAFICLQATAQLSLGAFSLSDQGSWNSLSDERLEELSLDFLLVKDMPDSALLVDRLLTSRLEQRNPMTFLQRRMLSLSLNRMAYLYSFSFFDYKHAIESLHKDNGHHLPVQEKSKTWTEGLGEEWQDWLRVEFRAEYRLLNINDAEDKITKVKENKSKNKTAWRSQAVCLI